MGRIPNQQLESTLAWGEAKTLWLGSVQRRSGQRADSKVLAGQDLALALDPVEDQGYAFSSARCDHGPRNDPDMVGVSPPRSRVWTGPATDLAGFVTTADRLLDRISTQAPRTSSFTSLLATRASTRPIQDAFEYVVLHPDLDDGPATMSEADAAIQRTWAEEREVSVTGSPYGPAFQVGVNGLDCVLDADASSSRISISCAKGHSGSDGPCAEARRVLPDERWATVRYGSGHTWMKGQLYEMRLRPADFSPSFAKIDVKKYNLREEKPRHAASSGKIDANGNPVLANTLAPDLLLSNSPSDKATSRSLFNWIVHERPAEVLPIDGWLACDDGSGEKADFVHFDPVTKSVSLIHVKAQHSSGNGVALTDFEQVVAQAVKNIRWLEIVDLAGEFALPATNVRDLVWRSGPQFPPSANRRKLFSDELKALGTNYRRRVVVVQPALSAASWKSENSKPKPYAAQLLSSLLSTAEAQCRSIGAEFVVVGRKP
jgi:hypothetical protein